MKTTDFRKGETVWIVESTSRRPIQCVVKTRGREWLLLVSRKGEEHRIHNDKLHWVHRSKQSAYQQSIDNIRQLLLREWYLGRIQSLIDEAAKEGLHVSFQPITGSEVLR